ncbi:MAG TPA: LytTR family DNA-binding domain-containing protein [Pseudomonadales bacterium]|nr:LytTR family DNA-binding domain-containing protein [Pseudomonadales bacterium]
MTLRTIIVDDEPLAIKLMLKWLSTFEEVDVVATCRNGREAIEQCEVHRPDAIFLDIQMPGMTGLDVVARLQGDVMPMVVFATAYDEFALHAFELNAIDYLLKPFDHERLALSVHRLLERQKITQGVNIKTPLISAITSIKQDAEEGAFHARKLAIKDGGEILLLPFESIEWVDAAGDYMCVHSGGETHIMRVTMKELEAKLNVPNFLRIHRSTIVNAECISSVTILPKGEAELLLHGGARLKVSRSYRQNIQYLLR